MIISIPSLLKTTCQLLVLLSAVWYGWRAREEALVTPGFAPASVAGVSRVVERHLLADAHAGIATALDRLP